MKRIYYDRIIVKLRQIFLPANDDSVILYYNKIPRKLIHGQSDKKNSLSDTALQDFITFFPFLVYSRASFCSPVTFMLVFVVALSSRLWDLEESVQLSAGSILTVCV